MDMLIHLHLWRIHTPRLFCFRPSLPLNRSTTLASSNAPTQASPPNTHYAVQYLVQSCGLSSDEALKALITVSTVSERTIDARLNNLRNIGFSQEVVALLISKFPSVLTISEKLVARKMEFLMKEAGCDKLHVIRNPLLFRSNLENQLIPRNIVRKLLMSKGIRVLTFATFASLSDQTFVERFILPYENVIPGLHRAFADAGRTKAIN